MNVKPYKFFQNLSARLLMICLVTIVALGYIASSTAISSQTEQKQTDDDAESAKQSADDDAKGDEEKAGDDERGDKERGDEEKTDDEDKKKVDFSAIDGQFKDLKPLTKDGEVWFSPTDKIVLVGGMVCLNRGQLEMFACTRGTKEHESIVVINGKAFEVHVGLMAIGAKFGKPVEWTPEFRPPTGSEIVVEVHWFDESGMAQKVNAQEWIQDSRTKKEMEYPWVFAGSSFYEDKETGQKHYMAEGGELVCVSNFSTAMLDLPTKSDDVDEGLLFSAFHERIPELRTPVRLVFRVKEEDKKKEVGKESDTEPTEEKETKKDAKETQDKSVTESKEKQSDDARNEKEATKLDEGESVEKSEKIAE